MHPNDGRVVSNFIVQALRGEPITVYGEGQQTRSFCFVDDLVEGLAALHGGGAGRTRAGQHRATRELAEEVIRLTGSTSRIAFAPLPSDDPMQRRPDVRLARSMFGWEPHIQLQEGLRKTIDYFDGLLSAGELPPAQRSARRSGVVPAASTGGATVHAPLDA
jgi:UDP-glucuronate decarboxylase